MLLCFLQSSLPTGCCVNVHPRPAQNDEFPGRLLLLNSRVAAPVVGRTPSLMWCQSGRRSGIFQPQPFPPGSALNGWSQGVVVKRRFTGSNYGGFGGRKREISRAAPPLWSSVCVFFHYMLFYTGFYVISSILVLVMIWKKQTTVVHGASPPKKRNDVFTWTTLRPRKLPNLTMHQPRKKREEECTTIFSRWGEPTK